MKLGDEILLRWIGIFPAVLRDFSPSVVHDIAKEDLQSSVVT